MGEKVTRVCEGSAGQSESLMDGFTSPPDSARPRVWWHWMNGNVTQEGIESDLQWMKRVGIAGLQNFDGALDTPQVVAQRLIYMTPPWQDAFRYAVQRAEELGLEFGIASSPGWSETGGPWVEPKDGMKKLVWSEVRIQGGESFRGMLPAPPVVSGPFQDIPILDVMTGQELPAPRFYRDVAVVAYRTRRALISDPKPVAIRTNVASVDVQGWLNAHPPRPLTLPLEDPPPWLLYDFASPWSFRALSLTCPVPYSDKMGLKFIIEASLDGKQFARLTELSANWQFPRITVAFPAVTAQCLRLTIVPGPPKSWAGFEFQANAPGAVPPPAYNQPLSEVHVRELHFYSGARIHHFEEKAGFGIAANYFGLEGPDTEQDEAIDPNHVIDLSGKMTPDGALDWSPPPGDWTVLRFGYSLTGKTNHPATAEATGLEVDKLDKRAVKVHLDHYFANFERTVGQDWIGEKGLRTFVTDSIESTGQNWTQDMLAEFQARRGYDLSRWLPALTGVVLGDTIRSERFLWDFRQTLNELITESHYGQIAAEVHARGMLYYSESLEGYPTAALGDDLDMRSPADVPMGALWTSYKLDEKDGVINHVIDMIGAASVAHVLGKTFVGCEAMTSANEPWVFSPQSLRPYMDLAFVLGVNRAVIHTSVHQPIEKKPGMSLDCFGQHFTRHETWAEMAEPWITYLSRTSFLLQQGRFVADIAWFYGQEGSAATLVSTMTLGDFPARYGFDLISPNMLLKHLRPQGGRLLSQGDASYRLLYLGGSSQRMTLAVLRKLKGLADAGVPIVGPRPIGSPSLADAEHESEFERLVSELWDRGAIVENRNPEAALHSMNVQPDFEYTASQPNSNIRFLHRTLIDAELYFVTNRRARPESIMVSFRTTGRKPELWHADTGAREAVSWHVETQRTVVALDLQNYQSVFVVFREPTNKTAETITPRAETTLTRLDGQWALTFEPDRGAPAEELSDTLRSWTQSDNPGIKYFSGMGTYRKEFTLSKLDLKAGERVVLDLGIVHELAEVILNGARVGTTWHAPFRVDVTAAVREGANNLLVRVANLWANRLIGDRQPGATPVAFTVTSTYDSDAPLHPSGLLGPVSVVREKRSMLTP